MSHLSPLVAQYVKSSREPTIPLAGIKTVTSIDPSRCDSAGWSYNQPSISFSPHSVLLSNPFPVEKSKSLGDDKKATSTACLAVRGNPTIQIYRLAPLSKQEGGNFRLSFAPQLEGKKEVSGGGIFASNHHLTRFHSTELISYPELVRYLITLQDK